MYAPSSTATAQPLSDANELLRKLDTALCQWTGIVSHLTSIASDSSYGGLPILGRMSDDRAASLDSYTEAERHAANSVIYDLNELVEFAVSNPSYVKLIRAHVDVLTLSARWSGKAFVTLYGYRRRSIGPVSRIRRGGRPAHVSRENCSFNDQPCSVCHNSCVGCGVHAATCLSAYPMPARCATCGALRTTSVAGDDTTIHDTDYHMHADGNVVRPFVTMSQRDRNVRLDMLGDLMAGNIVNTCLGRMSLDSIAGWVTNY